MFCHVGLIMVGGVGFENTKWRVWGDGLALLSKNVYDGGEDGLMGANRKTFSLKTK